MILPFCKLDTRGFPTICGSFSGKNWFSTSMLVYPRVIERLVIRLDSRLDHCEQKGEVRSEVVKYSVPMRR